jgi:hypothetical protein
MSGFAFPFSGWTMPLSLAALGGIYRSTHMLRRAADMHDHDSVAHIYLLLGNIASSFGLHQYLSFYLLIRPESRLRAIEDWRARSTEQRDSQLRTVQDLAQTYIDLVRARRPGTVVQDLTSLLTALLVRQLLIV